MSGTHSFASLDGSTSDHDGSANGVFTVSDGNLVVNGVVNCNDDSGSDSACAMAFAVSGNLSIGSGGALYAENRTGSGTGGAITLTAGGDVSLSGNAVISTASRSSSSASNGGAVTVTAGRAVTLASGTTIDSGSSNARAGAIAIHGGGVITVDGNVLSGPSRTFLSTRLYGGAALDGGSSNSMGGTITITSATFAEPAVLVGSAASIVSQGGDLGAGPVTIDGCGIQIRGLVAALARKDGPARVSIRSGKDVLVDGRDLGATGTRMGRVRADAPSGTGLNKVVEIFASETVAIHGLASGLAVVTSLPGLHDPKSHGGLVRITSLGEGVNASGNVIDAGHTASGGTGGTVEISAEDDVNLNTAVIRAVGDYNTNNGNRGGGKIRVRSYSAHVIWTNGTGDVRPVGSTSNLPPAEQGSIALSACGTVDTTGSVFPVMGSATSVFPQVSTGACSPASPSLPAGTPPLVTCNTPPVANDVTAATNEDTTVTIHLSGSDADGDSLTFSIVSAPANGALGPIVPTGPASATVNYTPAANFHGVDSFVYRADDGNGGSDAATATITIASVNDAPSFLAGPTVSVREDSGAQTYANWVTAIAAGPANESGQTVTFTVTTTNNALFAVPPAVSSSGTLTFTPAANAFGSATITLVATDDGGTANGGSDTSPAQSSSIQVVAVNDAPSFLAGPNQSVNEDAGPQTVAGWATSISAGPNESGQTVTFVVSSDNGALFSAAPAVSSSGTLTYTPAANANGTATVSVHAQDNGGTADGGDDTSPVQTFTITVSAVNDAPSFTSGGNVTVLEDSAAYSAQWATAISTGPADEAGQSVTFHVTGNTNASLFAAGPAVSPSGVLTFTLNANAFGSATVTVHAKDDGGTASGGADTSASVTFTITVEAVNDAPSFTGGGNVAVDEDSGSYSAPWASAISAGPNESGQTVTFVTSNDNGPLFSAQPAVSAAGVLTFTPAPNASGSATITVFAKDDGGLANGGADSSATVTFTITVNAVNDPPTAANDTWEALGNTELRVDRGAGATPHVSDTTASGSGVLDNDADAVEGDPIVVTGVVGCTDTTAPFVCAVSGGTLTLESNGSFTYQPSPGATSGAFQYTLRDQPSAGAPATATGSVTIFKHDMIWYVNGSAPPGGNGTSASPFNSFSPVDGATDVDGPGAYIFVHHSTVNRSTSLEPAQKLWGEGVGLVIPRSLNGNGAPTILVGPGPRPTISAVGDAVTVTSAGGVEIAGLNILSASGRGIVVSSPAFSGASSASIYANTITAAQQGIDVDSFNVGTTTVAIDGTGVTAGGNSVEISGGDGTVVFSYSNGTILSTGGSGIVADGSALDALVVKGLANVTVDGNTTGDGLALTVARFDANAGTAAFDTVNTGSVAIGTSANPVGGSAVTLTNVAGDLAFGSLSAHGVTAGATIAGSGLYTGTSGMRVTSAGGALSATSGTGLSVTSATIGASGLNLTSITAADAVNGIVLNTTGAGGLSVSGDGSLARNGSGGTIRNMSGDAVQLINANNVTLRSMNIINTGSAPASAAAAQSSAGNHAIDMNGGSSLVLSGVLIDNPRGSAVLAVNVGGTNRINRNSLITNLGSTAGHGIFVHNLNTNMTLFEVDASSMTNNASPLSNVFFANGGTANMRLDVVNGSVFENLVSQAVTAAAGAFGATTGTLTTNIGGALASNGNVFRDAASGGAGENSVSVLVGNGATHVARVQNNVFDNVAETGTVANSSVIRTQNSGGRMDVAVKDNTIRNIHYATGGRHMIGHVYEPLAFNGSEYSNVEISGNIATAVTFTGTNREMVFIDYRATASGGNVKILNNAATFTTAGNQQAIELRFRQTNPATINMRVDANSITQNTTATFLDIDAEAAATVNSTITNNTFSNPSSTPGAMIDVATEAATATACANISGNTLTPGTITVNEILGTLNVTQASSAALSAANGGAVVTVGGSPAFGQPVCALP